MPKKVVIVGAGPSGLLLAHYLLARQEKYQIEIYEQRLDPRTISISKSRTFPIALNERGMKALSKISGLETAVKAISREMRGSIIHQQNGKQKSISREKPLITLNRTELTKVLLDTLEQKYDKSRLNFYFQYSCTQVDLAAKTVSFESLTEGESEYSTVTYDLIIGADGARSVVRRKFLDLPLFELEQKYISNDYKSIFLPSQSDERAKIALESDKIHSWRMKDGTVILLLHQVDGSMNGVIHFPRKNNQIAALKNETEVVQFFQQNFPELGQMMSRSHSVDGVQSQAAEFLERPISSTLTICCSYYHYADSVLLIGDAAHAVSPSLGQGCNSALEDVFIFNQLLDEYTDDLSQALEQFTNRRLADAHAVVELSNNTLPFSNSLYIQFLIREYFAKILNRLFPKRFFPPLFEALYQSSITYTEILHAYQNWCSKVKRISVGQK